MQIEGSCVGSFYLIRRQRLFEYPNLAQSSLVTGTLAGS